GNNDLWYASAAVTPNAVWRDGTRMTQAASKAALGTDASATEYWPDGAGKVYVYSAGDANPTAGGHTFEIPQRDYALYASDKDYIKIQNLDLRYVNAILLLAEPTSAHVTGWEVTGVNAQGAWHGGISVGRIENGVWELQNKADGASLHGNSVSDIGGDATYGTFHVLLWSADSGKVDDNTITMADLPNNGYLQGIVYSHTSASGGDPTPEVLRNTVLGTLTLSQSYRGAGAIAMSNVNHALVADNDLHCGYVGIHFDEASAGANNGPAHCTVTRNRIVQSGALPEKGIFLEVSSDNVVSYNVVDARLASNYNKGLWVSAGGRTEGNADRNLFYGNTVLVPGATNALQVGWTGDAHTPVDTVVKNNIFYASGSGAILVRVSKASDNVDPAATFDHNLYYRAAGGGYDVSWTDGVDRTLAGFQAAFAPQEAHGVSGDPKFSDAAGGLVTLTSGSPAIDAGEDLGDSYRLALDPRSGFPWITINQDALGSGWEIGAFAFREAELSPALRIEQGVKIHPGARFAAAARGEQAPIFVQGNYGGGGSPGASATFSQAQTAGNLNAVLIAWQDATHDVSGVTDDAGNSYSVGAPTCTYSSGGVNLRQAIWFANNIASHGAGNVVTVNWNGDNLPVTPALRILEYSGLETAAPLDVSRCYYGTVTNPTGLTLVSSGGNNTTAADLLVGGGVTTYAFDSAAEVSVKRILPPDKATIAVDRWQATPASYNVSAYVSQHDQLWLMQYAAFRARGQSYTPPPPTLTGVTPNSGDPAGGTAITLAGTNFLSGASVTLGGTAATSVVVVSSTQITAVTPAHAAGAVDVKVLNPDGGNALLARGFTYQTGAINYTLSVTKSGSGNGAVNGTVGGGNYSCPSGQNCSGSYAAGSLVQLSASPSSGSSFSGWSGACAGSGACQFTLTSATTVTASFSSTSGVYTLGNQPPATWVPYSSHSQSIFNKQLPHAGQGGPMDHTIAQDRAASLATAGSEPGILVFRQPQATNDNQVPFYYADKSLSDSRWYKKSCGAWPLVTAYFLAPNNAQYGSTSASQDHEIGIWDQTNQIIVDMNGNYGTANETLGACSCTYNESAGDKGKSCACNASGNQCSAHNPASDPDWGRALAANRGDTGVGGPSGPLGTSAWAGLTYVRELQAAWIPHALILNYKCSSSNFPGANSYRVFPATANDGATALQCADTNQPALGARFFLDYTDDQIDNQMPSVKPLQKTLLKALAHYGAFTGVTGGDSLYISVEGFEGPQAYEFYSLTDPVFSWLESSSGMGSKGDGNNYVYHLWQNIPNLTGPNCTSACGVSGHLHIADPCVTIAQTGLDSYGGVAACQ
ncbi:MAG TPA: IPT/TIG domain-containing protein, partial [Terriglobales bacterium]|nr:IPT/TIG domain-containing protein [Terriglobales bacterium]